MSEDGINKLTDEKCFRGSVEPALDINLGEEMKIQPRRCKDNSRENKCVSISTLSNPAQLASVSQSTAIAVCDGSSPLSA